MITTLLSRNKPRFQRNLETRHKEIKTKSPVPWFLNKNWGLFVNNDQGITSQPAESSTLFFLPVKQPPVGEITIITDPKWNAKLAVFNFLILPH